MREWGKVWTSCKHKCLLCYKNRYNKEYGILIRSYSSLFHHRGLVIRAMKRLCHGVIVRWRLNLVPIVPCYRVVAQSLSHNRTIVFWTFMHMRCLQENGSDGVNIDRHTSGYKEILFFPESLTKMFQVDFFLTR